MTGQDKENESIEFTSEESSQVRGGLLHQYKEWDHLLEHAGAGPAPDVEHIAFMKEMREACVTAFKKLGGRDIEKLL